MICHADSFRILGIDRNNVNAPWNVQQNVQKNESHGVHKLEKTPALCLISIINCSKNLSKNSLFKKLTDFFHVNKNLLKQITQIL